jgi:hypothetical protein
MEPACVAKTKDDYVFSALEEAAAAGERCPTNIQLATFLNQRGFERAAGSSIPQIVGRLAKQGRVVVRIYGKNYRDVLICTGEHAGRITQPPPHGGAPYLMLDAQGRRPLP